MLEKLKVLNEENDRFDVEFDETEGFPPTRQDRIQPKTMFNSDFAGQDPDAEHVLNTICDKYMDE